jgi:hypothetical protein
MVAGGQWSVVGRVLLVVGCWLFCRGSGLKPSEAQHQKPTTENQKPRAQRVLR